MPPEPVPSPWRAFLAELDAHVAQAVELHCIGGFVLSVLYGMPRPTAGVDVLSVVPRNQVEALQSVAGQGSPLHRKHGVYLHHVAVASLPEDYEERLIEIFPSKYKRLRLFGVEAYDLALSKLERNASRDREDVKYLARSVPLNLEVLERRYRTELRPYLAAPERHDLTMQLWREAIAAG